MLRGENQLLEVVRVDIGGGCSSEVERKPKAGMLWLNGQVFCKGHIHSQRHDRKMSSLVTGECT
jgi:hypothetical protein